MVQTFESGYASTLSQKFSATDVTMYVATPPTVTAGRIYLTDGSQKEWVSFSGVSGSTLTGCVRGLSRTADPATAGSGLNWLAGNPIVLVAQHDQLRDKNQATEALIFGKTYATTADRDSALGADGAAVHPYTNVYVTATGLHYNYNLSTAMREPASNGVATPNASTTAAGKVEQATIPEITARTATGGTGAPLFINPNDQGVINMTAGEDLTAGKAVCAYNGSVALKSIRRFANSPMTATTGTGNSATQRCLYSLSALFKNIYVYKKTADNKIYARTVDWTTSVAKVATFDTPTVGTEYVLSSDALEAADGFGAFGVYNSGGNFIVTYKKASDDKPYIVCCDVSGTVITPGTPVKVYDAEILQSGTRPTCCMPASDSGRFTIGIHNDTSDDPVVISGTISGTVPTVTQTVVAESVTMAAAGQVLVAPISNGGIAVFYDDGTNIKMNQITQNGATVKTPVTLYAGYVPGNAKAVNLDVSQNSWYEVYLGIASSGYIRMSRVMIPDGAALTQGVYIAGMDSYIPTRTSTLSCWDMCDAGVSQRPQSSANTADLAVIYKQDNSSENGFQLKIYQPGTNGLSQKYSEALYVYDSSAPLGVAMCNIGGSFQVPILAVPYISTTSTTLGHSCFYNNEKFFCGVVKTTTLSAGTVPIVYSGPVTVSGAFPGEAAHVRDAGALYYNGTKQVGMTIATDTILLI